MMIEAVTPANMAEVLPLIRLYQEFYQVADIREDRNDEFFRQFGPESPLGCLFLCRSAEGRAVGFATVYFGFSSTAAAKVGIMNDLYTLPEFRRQGIGERLIRHCRDYAVANGAIRLQWTTAMDNHTAQSIYNSLGATSKPWLFYTWSGVS